MFIKWLSSTGNVDLLSFDSVSKFSLVSNSIIAYDSFVSTKAISTGAFTSKDEALRVFNEIVRRLNLFMGTDEDVNETDMVFDVQDWLANTDSW